MKRWMLCLASAALMMTACGPKGSQENPTQTTQNEEPTEEPTTEPAEPAVAWGDMDYDQRIAYMKNTVVPTMRPIMQEFDPDEFGKVNCATCHGSSVKDGDFSMPSTEIHPLPNSEAGWAELQEHEPEMMQFMAMTVKPKMAELLGEKEFNPEKPEEGGFGCSGCHTTAQ